MHPRTDLIIKAVTQRLDLYLDTLDVDEYREVVEDLTQMIDALLLGKGYAEAWQTARTAAADEGDADGRTSG
jgi:hypothetical protein